MYANRIVRIVLLLGVIFGAGPLMAADYSVTTVRPITSTGFDPGNGLNLYSITARGVELVKGSPYVFKQLDFTGQLASVFAVVMSPDHDFVYVVYSGIPQPIVVGFDITPKGLVYQWQTVFTTGSERLSHGATVVAENDFLVGNANPSGFVHLVAIFNQSGQIIAEENSSALVSGHVNRNGKFYYSCRSSTSDSGGGVPPADSVAVFDLKKGLASRSNTVPVVTSKDPKFVRSVCN
jgi:hypothetical protein